MTGFVQMGHIIIIFLKAKLLNGLERGTLASAMERKISVFKMREYSPETSSGLTHRIYATHSEV